jgi:death-on-curing protein
MRYLTLSEVMYLHRRIVEATGGAEGLRDPAALSSALAQPRATFGSTDLHATLLEKAAALCFSLVANHPFVDGNKRVAHAAMEVFLNLNGIEITASAEDQEELMLSLASGTASRAELLRWLVRNTGQA